MTPYDILGISKDSTREELESRYKLLKAEYSEGRFKPGAEGMEAARKLNDLENAWLDVERDLQIRELEEFQNKPNFNVNATANAENESENDTQNAEKVADEEKKDIPELKAEEVKKESTTPDDTFKFIDKLIAEKKYDEAQKMLDDIMDRNGEWHFLQSKIYFRRDWLTESRKHLEIALSCDPDNEKYKNAYEKMKTIGSDKNADPRRINREEAENVDPRFEAENESFGNSLLSSCCASCALSLCCEMCCRC